MDKSPEAFRTISEVAETLDVPPHVLRFWETRFNQVKPVKRGGGRRYYRPEDVRLLRGIRGLLYDDGMTIKGVQKILRERGIRHVIGLGTLTGEPAATHSAAPVAPALAASPRAPAASQMPAPADPVQRRPEPAPSHMNHVDGHASEVPGAAPSPVPGILETTLLAPDRPAWGHAAASEAEPKVPATDGQAVAVTLTGSGRRAALAALVAELEALRAVMARARKG